MAQFTFIELHLEEGSIPQPSVLGSGKQASATSESDTGEAPTGGNGLGKLLFAFVVFAIAVALARKLRGAEKLEIEES